MSSHDPYLSISYTAYDDGLGPENGMTSSLLCYDINSKELTNVYQFSYTSQYPLGCLDMGNNDAYFTAESKTRENCDELFVCNLQTNEVRQLTDTFFAINYVLPSKNDIFIAAVKRKTLAIRPVMFDKRRDTLVYGNLEDDDTCIEFMSLSANGNGDIYASTYSNASRYEASERQNELGYWPIPDYSVVKFTGGDLAHPETIFVAQSHMVMSVSSNAQFILTKEIDDFSANTYKAYIYDIKNGVKTEIELVGAQTFGTLLLAPDGNGAYFIGTLKSDSEQRGVYFYDFSTELISTIALQETEGFINNMALIP
jgi:hypothetical protein